ncbi:hypothetical protein VIGAN_05023500 [Vigna angularis var. angularis]|uniref:Uncharacterized protein n=1 Tax=Vigna angularis var. angularis TaxID=157739 RepID=A0A0S3S244_PHAAN|nr:protein PELPK2-like [Vigna angularis]BAT86905.1 hypothetical protein VIGAN_05023500 [Vigna angularis var. angularis]
MASSKSLITAFVLALTFSSMSMSLAARHLLQTTAPNFPSIPSLPKSTLPPLPSLPQFNLPPMNSLPSFPTFTFPTTMPSIPFLSPPPSTSSP